MCIPKGQVWAALVALVSVTACTEPPALDAPLGGVELVVSAGNDARVLGALTLRGLDSDRAVRLPVRAEGYQRGRVSLPPGLYALDFERDVTRAASLGTDPAAFDDGQLPRWIVVAPARITTLHVSVEHTPSGDSLATTLHPALDGGLTIN